MARSERSVEKERFWREVVEDQRQGGLSVRRFCQQNTISEPSFYAWRRELQKRDAEKVADAEKGADAKRTADGNGRLIPVDVVHVTGENSKPGRHDALTPLEIRTPRGFTLRFDHETTPETVARWLDVIARCPGGGAASC